MSEPAVSSRQNEPELTLLDHTYSLIIHTDSQLPAMYSPEVTAQSGPNMDVWMEGLGGGFGLLTAASAGD